VYVETSEGRAPNRVVMAASIGLVVVVWAVNFIAAKIGLHYLPAVTMASFRVAIAGLTMAPAYLICSRLPAFADARRARLQGFTRRDLWTFFYLGFFGVVVNQMCFTMGLRYTSVTMAAFNHFAGAIIILPVALHQARALGLFSRWRAIPWQGWVALLYMAVFSSALAYIFYFWLLRYLEASQLSAFTYLLPVLAMFLGIVWLGERGSSMQIVGGALALSGVYWVESGREP